MSFICEIIWHISKTNHPRTMTTFLDCVTWSMRFGDAVGHKESPSVLWSSLWPSLLTVASTPSKQVTSVTQHRKWSEHRAASGKTWLMRRFGGVSRVSRVSLILGVASISKTATKITKSNWLSRCQFLLCEVHAKSCASFCLRSTWANGKANGKTSACILSSSFLATLGAGLSTALVIDIGEAETRVTPVEEGYPLPHCSAYGRIGGAALTSNMEMLRLRDQSTEVSEVVSSWAAESAKEQSAWVAQDFNAELQRLENGVGFHGFVWI